MKRECNWIYKDWGPFSLENFTGIVLSSTTGFGKVWGNYNVFLPLHTTSSAFYPPRGALLSREGQEAGPDCFLLPSGPWETGCGFLFLLLLLLPPDLLAHGDGRPTNRPALPAETTGSSSTADSQGMIFCSPALPAPLGSLTRSLSHALRIRTKTANAKNVRQLPAANGQMAPRLGHLLEPGVAFRRAGTAESTKGGVWPGQAPRS